MLRWKVAASGRLLARLRAGYRDSLGPPHRAVSPPRAGRWRARAGSSAIAPRGLPLPARQACRVGEPAQREARASPLATGGPAPRTARSSPRLPCARDTLRRRLAEALRTPPVV